jgi:hemolysin III
MSSYTPREELVHCLMHGLGIAASLVAIPWLAWTALHGGDTWRLVSGVIFGASALLLFTTSVSYHAATDPPLRTLLRRFDHCAIYILIAGTYTPFMLGVMRGDWGWTFFGLVWGMALLGIIAKTTSLGFRYHKTSVLLYVVMGWIIVIAARPLMRVLTHSELMWLMAGVTRTPSGMRSCLPASHATSWPCWASCPLSAIDGHRARTEHHDHEQQVTPQYVLR